MALSLLDQVRLAIGDTDSTDVLFTDAEIQQYLDNNADSVKLAAADLCDVAATTWARRFTFSTDQQSFNLSDVTKAYAERAKVLRRLATGGVASVASDKVDGYSQTIAADEATTSANVSEGSGGRVRSGYFVDDRPY